MFVNIKESETSNAFFQVEIPSRLEKSFQELADETKANYPDDPHVLAADYALWLMNNFDF